MTLGRLLNKSRKVEAAMAAYQAARALSPNNVGALGGIASIFTQQAKIEEAIEAIRAAIQIAPNSAALRVRLGQLLEERHELEDAAAAFRSAVEIDPKHVLAQAGLTRVRNPDQVFALFQSLLNDPEQAELLDALAGELKITRDMAGQLVRFALDPQEAEIASIASTPLDRELAHTIIQATLRHAMWDRDGTVPPAERLQIAPPSTDSLAVPGSP